MNPPTTQVQPSSRRGIDGPAKWAAVAVLGSVGIVGVGKNLLTPSPTAPADPQPTLVSIAQPASEHPDTLSQIQPAPSKPSAPAPSTPDIGTRININAATAAQLDLLPRIGPVLAERIIQDRRTNGPFRSIADIQRVRGIGPRTADKLKDLISFD
ncbi:MAG TPA: hypothetical protein ENJ00_04810 [Phycisphaerales bacterium]|nr:hypothetical protein [Phycisphaerales bacterium]